MKHIPFNTPLRIKIEKLVFQGWGMGTYDGFKIFAPNTLPGDTVDVILIKKKRSYGMGKVKTFIERSPLIKEAHCSHALECGGCQMMNVPYADQLLLKEDIFKECIQSFYKELLAVKKPILGCKDTLYYRNKMEFSFGKNEKGLILGLKRRGSYDDIIDIQACMLQDPLSDVIRHKTLSFFNQTGLSAWNYSTRKGCLRLLMVRHSKTNHEFLLKLIVSESDHLNLYKDYVSFIQQEIPEVKSVIITLNPNEGDNADNHEDLITAGPGILHETLGDLTFKINSKAFFQTNTTQASVLYDTIKSTATLKPTDTVLDLYCGTGTIGLYLAKSVKAVIGVEEIEEAIENAQENAQNNNIHNATFYVGRVKNILKFTTIKADCIILDPPRSGIVPKALQRIINLDAPQIIYVSCNPSTMTRDLKELSQAGYTIESLQPVDMFPNTFHVECVAKLTKSPSKILV